MGIFVCLVVCQGLVKGTSEHGYKCETVTETRPDFCCQGVECHDSSGVLQRFCWAVGCLMQSLLKQSQFQGGISLPRAVQSWPVCSVEGGWFYPPPQVCPGSMPFKGWGSGRWGCDKSAVCINSFGAWKSQRLNHKVCRRILFWKCECKFAAEVQCRPISV